MKFLLPQGVGDSCWAMFKIQSIRDRLAPGEPIDAYLTCSERSEVQERALDFLRRFDFIRKVDMRTNYGILNCPNEHYIPFTPGGYWDYIEDGWYNFKDERFCVLIPNATLERGVRLEQWLPQYSIDWDIFSHFRITSKESTYGAMVKSKLGPYAVFYLGPLHGNTIEGHNRGMLWKPAEWVQLGELIHKKFGLSIVVVGAEYDHDYYNHMLAPRLNGSSSHWVDLIGRTSLGELWSVTSNAKFVISYQSGVGIVSTYLGTPTAMWWRRRGDSISQAGFLSFEEEMSCAWVPPATLESGKYLPMIYGGWSVDNIADEITARGWCK